MYGLLKTYARQAEHFPKSRALSDVRASLSDSCAQGVCTPGQLGTGRTGPRVIANWRRACIQIKGLSFLPVPILFICERCFDSFRLNPGGNAMERTFESWIGHPVVLELALGRIKLDVSGTILKDCGKTLLMKPETGPDVEIPRDHILKIVRANPWIHPRIKFL